MLIHMACYTQRVDNLCSKFTGSQTDSTFRDAQRILLSAGRAWRSSSAPQLCTYAYLCLYVTESRASPPRTVEALSLPSDAPQEATFLFLFYFFGRVWEGGGGGGVFATINPYNLEYFSVTHTVCASNPSSSPSCSQNRYGGEQWAHLMYPSCAHTKCTQGDNAACRAITW